MATVSVNDTVTQTLIQNSPDEWDGRGRFGAGIPAGSYNFTEIEFDEDDITREKVAFFGRNYGPNWLRPVGNHCGIIGCCEIDNGKIFACSGSSEGAESYAVINPDNSYFSTSTTTGRGATGFQFNYSACSFCPSLNRAVLFNSVSGALHLVNTTAWLVISNTAGSSKTNPVGFPSHGLELQSNDISIGGTTLAVSYLEYDLVRIWTVGASGLTWVRDHTVSKPSGVAVKADGTVYAITGNTFVYKTFRKGVQAFAQIDSISGGSFSRLNGDGSTTQIIAAGSLTNPFRASFSSSGKLAISSWTPDNRIRVYDSSFTLTNTLGTAGGRIDGTYINTDFRRISDVEWSADELSLWVSEHRTMPRTTRKILVSTGAVQRELIGGNIYNAGVCPEGGDDATKVWHSTGEGLVRHSFDLVTGSWSILETYNLEQDEQQIGIYLKSVRSGGKIYFWSMETYFRIYLYDPIGKTIRLIYNIGITYASAELFLPESVRTVVAAAYPGTFCYQWTAPLGGPNTGTPTPIAAECIGFNPSSISNVGNLHLDSVLTWWCASSKAGMRLTPVSVRADGVPIYNPALRHDFIQPKIDGYDFLSGTFAHPDPDGIHYYQLIVRSIVGDSDPVYLRNYAISFQNQTAGCNYLIKVNRTTETVIWATGVYNHSYNHGEGRVNRPGSIIAVKRNLIWIGHFGDVDTGGLAVYDSTSGRYVTDISKARPTGNLHPVEHRELTYSESVTGSVITDPNDSTADLFFSTNIAYSAIWRIRGLDTLTRTVTAKTISSATPAKYTSGTGLTVQVYNNGTLTGSPSYSSTTRNYTRILEAPLAGVITNTPFSATIEGTITPVKTDRFRISVYPGGANVKLWIGGVLVCDSANMINTEHRLYNNSIARSNPVLLTALQPVSVRAEITNATLAVSGDVSYSERRFIALTWANLNQDEIDIPIAQCLPSGSGTAIPSSSFDNWVYPELKKYQWKLQNYASQLSPGISDTPSFHGYGNISSFLDNSDGRLCLEMKSTLNAPAILWLDKSPVPLDFDPMTFWYVEFKVKSSIVTDRFNDWASFGFIRYAFAGYVSHPNLNYSGAVATIDTHGTAWTGLGLLFGSTNIATVNINDGSWHKVRYAIDTTGLITITVDDVIVYSVMRLNKRESPWGIAIGPPVPPMSGIEYSWRVRDLTVEALSSAIVPSNLIFYWTCCQCNLVVQSVEVAAGTPGIWIFQQLEPAEDLTGRVFEVRVGFSVPVVWSMATGKVYIDGISVRTTVLESDTINQSGTKSIELWETGISTNLPKRYLLAKIKFSPVI